MSLLRLRDLKCTLGNNPVLHGVNLTLERGETLGLVGESGSGKSMTALAIMRLLPDHAQLSGDIDFEGRNLATLDEGTLCSLRGGAIGLIFQEPMTALNPLKTVIEQVAEVYQLHQSLPFADALDRARAMMDRVGLAEIPGTRYPHELSGGQRQRIVIAMAVACGPKLIIADEPTSALDVTTQAQILAMLKELAVENEAALLLISHDLAVVASLADRIAVMKDGTIVEESETASFFGAMHHPYSRALYAASVHRPRRAVAAAQAPFFVAEACTRFYRKPRLFRPALLGAGIDDVSLAIAPGESVGLVGESGSGKSTLARALLGLDPLDNGAIILDGETLDLSRANDRRTLRRKVQLVFQDPYSSFDPRRTIGWSVAEPLTLFETPVNAGEAKDRVTHFLEQVGLPADFIHRYPHEMSGGQRQRAAIARALITEPELIVLDEPVSALDVFVRAQILDLLARLQEPSAVAYLLITHDLSLLSAVTDRALVMDKGRIIEAGSTEQILSDPQSDYTRSLVRAAPDLVSIVASLRPADEI